MSSERLAYSPQEAAQAMGLSVRTIRYLIHTGKLGFSQVGRRVLIPVVELERFLQETFVESTEPLTPHERIRPLKEGI